MRRGTLTHERVTVPTETQSPETSTETTCVHHWIIDSPAGASSTGVCKICGERREFQNYVGDFIWEGGGTAKYEPVGWKSSVTEMIRPDSTEGEDSSFSSPDRVVGETLAL